MALHSRDSANFNHKGGNAFMALVDAAASLVDEGNKPKDCVLVAQTKQSGCDEVSYPQAAKTSEIQDKNKKMSFAEQLMAALEDDSNSSVITWMPDGKAFTIIDHKNFVLDSMPRLFSIRNMSSFVRKLGRWGFQRVHEKATRNSDIFKHKFFQRGDWNLCRKIKCIGRVSNPPIIVSPPSSDESSTETIMSQVEDKTSIRENCSDIKAKPQNRDISPTNKKSAQSSVGARHFLARDIYTNLSNEGVKRASSAAVSEALENVRSQEDAMRLAILSKINMSNIGSSSSMLESIQAREMLLARESLVMRAAQEAYARDAYLPLSTSILNLQSAGMAAPQVGPDAWRIMYGLGGLTGSDIGLLR